VMRRSADDSGREISTGWERTGSASPAARLRRRGQRAASLRDLELGGKRSNRLRQGPPSHGTKMRSPGRTNSFTAPIVTSGTDVLARSGFDVNGYARQT
jgi:hypothetical protein